MSVTEQPTAWVLARNLRIGDSIRVPDGGSSRAYWKTRADVERSSAPFRTIIALEHTGPEYVIPPGRNEVHLTLEERHFHRLPETAEVLILRS